MMNEDGQLETGTSFCDESTDKILEERTETRQVGSRAGNTFSVATFTVNEAAAGGAEAAPEDGAPGDFSWEDFYGEEAVAAAAAAAATENMVDGPRVRKKVRTRRRRTAKMRPHAYG